MRFNPFVPHGPEPITPTPKSGGFVPSVVEFFKKRIDELFRRDSASVHYTPEEKTGEEKTIARGNIGAQEKLVSGVNLKTVGGRSLLGGGDVPVEPPVWGGITGNLGDQGDLAETLSGKADRSETYTKAETDAEITANVEDSVTSVSATKALSARMGRELQDQIQNLKQRGRYLSIWDCTTGLAKTEPTVNPYAYKAGDYFIIGTVGTANYRPSGTQYDKTVPSTAAETGTPIVNDTYYYDGSSWSLLHTEQAGVSWGSVAGKPDWVDSDTKPTYTAGEVGVSLAAGSQSVALAVGGTSAVMPTSEFMALLNSYKLDKADVIDPASATGAGKAADALATKNALAGVITEDDVKRVYNPNNTQYIDGNGDVYTAQFEEGGHWNMICSAGDVNLYYIGYETSLACYRWRDPNNYNRIVIYNPSSGRVGTGGSSVDTGRKSLNPENGDDIGGPYVISGATLTFFKQSSVFPETPSDSIVKKSDVVAPTGSAAIDTSKAAQAEATRQALASKLDVNSPTVEGGMTVENGMTVKGSVYSESLYTSYGEGSTSTRYAPEHIENGDDIILLPSSSGTLALTSDVPDVSDKADSVAVAPAYNPTKTYAVDSPVTYGGRLYKCKTAITTAEAWNPAHWTEFAATDSDTAFVVDDNGHLVAKDTATGNDLYVDAYRMNSGTTIKDAAFNDLGTIAEGASFALPAAIAGHMRDFAVILQIGATVPSFTFPLTSSDLEPWSEEIPEWAANMIYRITMTETRANKWEIHVASKGVA